MTSRVPSRDGPLHSNQMPPFTPLELGSLQRNAEVGLVGTLEYWQEEAVLAAAERNALREEVFRLKAEREGMRTRQRRGRSGATGMGREELGRGHRDHQGLGGGPIAAGRASVWAAIGCYL